MAVSAAATDQPFALVQLLANFAESLRVAGSNVEDEALGLSPATQLLPEIEKPVRVLQSSQASSKELPKCAEVQASFDVSLLVHEIGNFDRKIAQML